MARLWNRLSASASLVLLMQLALSAVTFGEGGVCPSYPPDPSWKSSMSAQEMTLLKFWKKRNLRLEGTFKQGAKVLLKKPAEAHNSVPDELQGVEMVLRRAHPSESRGIFKVSVSLALAFRPKHSQFNPFDESGKIPRPGDASQHGVKIVGDGTFDEGTGELCVLGCIHSVCKYKLSLKYPTPKTILNVSVEGNLTSVAGATDETYFDPVSIHAFHDAPFQYTMNATVASVCPNLAPDVEVGKLWNEDDSDDACFGWSPLLWQALEVSWNPECKAANCSPFVKLGNAAAGNTSFLRFERMACGGHDRMQANLLFSNSPLNFGLGFTDPTSTDGTLLAEGVWNSTTGQLCMIACRLYGKRDCEIAITMQFPLTFTVMQRSSVVGHIQSLRSKTDPSHFKPITFRQISQGSSQGVSTFSIFSEEELLNNAPNQREYVYTKVKTAKALCANLHKQKKKSSSGTYPSGEDWRDLVFSGVSKDLQSTETKLQPNFNDPPWQRLDIFTRGNEFIMKTFDQVKHNGANVTGLGLTDSAVQDHERDGILNVSYALMYQIGQRKENGGEQHIGPGEHDIPSMAGEGIYDSYTGKLCLIGCRAVELKREGLQQLEGDPGKDCRVFFSLQLPPIGSAEALKGTVESLRSPTDPLYFKSESFSGTVYMQAMDSLWRVDLEIVLSVLMLSLTVMFLVRQLLYSKRHAETMPYISISMLLLLSLAYMLPFVVDFEALFQKQPPGRSIYQMMESVGGWPEVNKVVVRFTTMAAMLLQLRLLQLVWKARAEARVTRKLAPTVEEGRLLRYILLLYVAGGLIAILFHAVLRFKPYEREFLWRSDQGGMWWDLHAYGGLLVDFHLLPQVIANILWNVTEQAPLSKWFYVGMALVRSVPHLYDLCRQFRFIPLFSDMYLYANPEWDFYSVTSDILIPSFIVLLAVMVSKQQRGDGRCVVPRRWRRYLEYEKVENPIATYTL